MMASAARDLRYRKSGMVDGSLAHDLDWAVRERELQHAGEMPRRRETAQETPKVRTEAKTKVLVRERQQVSAFSVLGFPRTKMHFIDTCRHFFIITFRTSFHPIIIIPMITVKRINNRRCFRTHF